MILTPEGERFVVRCGLTLDGFHEILTAHPAPAPLVLGIIATESAGNPDAMRFEPGYPYTFQTKTHAETFRWTERTEIALQSFSYGLMQIMLATAREMGFGLHPRLLLIPKINLAWGTQHLTNLKHHYGSWMDAVAAYNFGHPAKTFLSGQYKNQDYVDKVYGAAARFERLGT